MDKAFPKKNRSHLLATLPLHQKGVPCLNTERLLKLPSHSVECLENARRALQFLADPGLYEKPQTRIRATKMADRLLREMEGYKYGPLPPGVKGKAGLLAFPVIEKEDTRLRGIQAPDLNDVNVAPSVAFPPKWVVDRHSVPPTRASARKSWAKRRQEDWTTVQFDLAAWFDQFGLGDELRPYFCFLVAGKEVALHRLPMGLRHAVFVAQSALWQLLNFPRSAAVDTTIDNVRFTGTKSAVMKDAVAFLRRCAVVGATLNVVGCPSVDATPKELAKLVEAQLEPLVGDFLGTTYLYGTSEKKNQEKTVRKLSFLRDAVGTGGPLSRRQVATVFGVLFYAASVVRAPLAPYYDALRYLRKVSATGGDDWDCLAGDMPPLAREQLLAWLGFLVANKPVPILVEEEEPRFVVITDASGEGWGAISVDTATGSLMEFSFPWTGLDVPRAQSSVWAEPEAIFLAVCRISTPGDAVLVLTDHQPAEFADASGYAKSWSLNQLVLRMQRLPGVRVTIRHIPGKGNPADGLSRTIGSSLTGEEQERARTLAAGDWGRRLKVDARLDWQV